MIADVWGVEPYNQRLLDPRQLEEALATRATKELCYEHLDPDIHGRILKKDEFKTLKTIFLYRHPLDALISRFEYLGARQRLPEAHLTPKEHLKLYLREHWLDKQVDTQGGRRMEFAMNLRNYIRRFVLDWVQTPGMFGIRYEDFVREPERSLETCLQHFRIGYTPEQITHAVEKNRFEVLSGGRPIGTEDKSSHYRKGLSGEWREVFDRDDLELIRSQIGDYLQLLGYAIDHDGIRP